jgi:hypothetical protein
LYHLHIQNGKQWGNLWNLISQNITDKLDIKMNINYKDINNKIRKVEEQKIYMQTTGKRTNHTFYKRTENRTDVVLTDTEMQLLNKGLKYNLHNKHKKNGYKYL